MKFKQVHPMYLSSSIISKKTNCPVKSASYGPVVLHRVVRVKPKAGMFKLMCGMWSGSAVGGLLSSVCSIYGKQGSESIAAFLTSRSAHDAPLCGTV